MRDMVMFTPVTQPHKDFSMAQTYFFKKQDRDRAIAQFCAPTIPPLDT